MFVLGVIGFSFSIGGFIIGVFAGILVVVILFVLKFFLASLT